MRTLKSEPVFPYFKNALEGPLDEAAMRVVSFLDARIQKGIQTYGEELHTFNGRDALMDLAEELGDAILYLMQYARECEVEKKKVPFFAHACVALLLTLGDVFAEIDRREMPKM